MTKEASQALVVGTGLIGSSIALGLRQQGWKVYLKDISPTQVYLASELTGAIVWSETTLDQEENAPKNTLASQIKLVVIATPVDVSSNLVIWALLNFPQSLVIDVCSVKDSLICEIIEIATRRKLDYSSYLATHPMGGSEQTGPKTANHNLFNGRPWIICPHSANSTAQVSWLKNLIMGFSALPVVMESQTHDQSVALVSHLPQVIASVLAGRLTDASDEAVNLAGQGLRDTVRIAASPASMWNSIIWANRESIGVKLEEVIEELTKLTHSLKAGSDDRAGTLSQINQVITKGNQGIARLPLKFTSSGLHWKFLEVLIPDRPGELARLFQCLGQANINIEDLKIEHSPRQPKGMAKIYFQNGVTEKARQVLLDNNWRLLQ